MRYLRTFVLLLILITTPTTLIFPRAHIKKPRKYKLMKCLKKENRYHKLHYDQVLKLLRRIESGEAAKKYKKKRHIGRIEHFLAYLSVEGNLKNFRTSYGSSSNKKAIFWAETDKLAAAGRIPTSLAKDLREYLFDEPEFAFASTAAEKPTIAPAVYKGEDEFILQTGSVSKFWKKTKKFVKKHKKAIIIGAIIVIIVATVVIVAVASSGGGAAAGAAAAAAAATAKASKKEEEPLSLYDTPDDEKPVLERINDFPEHKQIVEEKIYDLKHQLAQEEALEEIGLKPKTDTMTFGERVKGLGSKFAHEALKDVATFGSVVPQYIEEANLIDQQVAIKRFLEPDTEFAPTPTEIYNGIVTKLHESIDHVFNTDQADMYDPNAEELPSQWVIGEIPPPGKFPKFGRRGRGIARGANKPAAVAKETRQVEKEVAQLEMDVSLSESEALKTAIQKNRHVKMVENYLNKPVKEIQKGVNSYEKQIAIHKDKIVNPTKHCPDWNKLDPRQREALINKKWPIEIKNFEEQRDILQSILNERLLYE